MAKDNSDRNEQERILDMGREAAEENVKNDDVRTRENDEKTFERNMDSARESAELNYEADQSRQGDRIQEVIPANDTSKAGKQATAKAQLDPNGDDPISSSEVNKSATNASMETGNKTAVSNEEVAERAKNPGRAEENGPRALSNPDRNSEQNAESEKVSERSTTNRGEAREDLKARKLPIVDQSSGSERKS